LLRERRGGYCLMIEGRGRRIQGGINLSFSSFTFMRVRCGCILANFSILIPSQLLHLMSRRLQSKRRRWCREEKTAVAGIVSRRIHRRQECCRLAGEEIQQYVDRANQFGEAARADITK